MPISFQIGLFLTVLALAGVRFRKSLDAVRRSHALPDGTWNWERWFHLAILFGIFFFCLPSLGILAVPEKACELSLAIDRILGEGGRPQTAALERPVSSEGALAHLESMRSDFHAGRRRAMGALAGTVAAAVAFFVASSAAVRARRPLAICLAAFFGLIVAALGFISSGRSASMLTGATEVAVAISEYSKLSVLRAEEAQMKAGPAVLEGRPTNVASGGPAGYLYLRTEGDEKHHVSGAFSLGPVKVKGPFLPVRPRVRLAQHGRESFIRSDEDVLAAGFLIDGELRSEDPYPLAVAPAEVGASLMLQELNKTLAGRSSERSQLLAGLQLVWGAFAAYFKTLLLALAAEFLLKRRRHAGAGEFKVG